MASGCGCKEVYREISSYYRRSGFDCVVKRLRTALYKPDCDFNDCELPRGKYIINCVFFFLRFF